MTIRPDSPVMTVSECARYLGIGRTFAYEMIRRNAIPHIRLGRKILIPKAAVQRMLAETGKDKVGSTSG